MDNEDKALCCRVPILPLKKNKNNNTLVNQGSDTGSGKQSQFLGQLF